ncbi:MAG: General stress protein 16O [Microgenomates bacterium OLB22]|nr:MAG: General stress protein 16O [Microgenomates bacterium OLB22]
MTAVFDKKQLQEFKNLLVSKQKSLEKDIDQLKKSDPFVDPARLIDNALEDDVQEQGDHERIQSEIQNLQTQLALVEHALRKTDGDTYGICEKSGEQIPVERLRLVPEARCKVEYED